MQCPHFFAISCLIATALAPVSVHPVQAGPHRVLLQGNGRLVVLAADGSIEWERPWGGLHDCHELENGNFLVLEGRAKVCEIDRQTKEVVWSYNAAMANGNQGKDIEVHACQPLDNGNVMIAETTTQRIIEVNRQGEIVKSTALTVNHPHPHTDTRLARKIANGNYLVSHEGDGMVREYDGHSGKVVWDYAVPMFDKQARDGHGPEAFGNKTFCALRLPSGNTLLSTGNGHSVLEVSPDREIVWQLHQNDLPGITLAWVTTLEVLSNGNYVIGNCHAGPDNPLLIEINPKTKEVVWTLDRHADFGDSVSNSQLLGLESKSIR
jgi:outer membrane protein assembly factor BamB